MKRLLHRIKQIASRHPRHYFGRLWHWAVKPGYAAKRKRFKALISWARDHYALAHSKERKHSFWKASRAYRKKRKLLKKHHHHKDPPLPQGNFVNFDGHLVPRWIVEQALQPARSSGTWVGVVISGFRTPEYSTSLCMAMCGAPTCPGRCAGANSNHSCPPSHTGVPYEGAVDVSDSYGLMRWEGSHGYPIRHTLPNDLNHHSRTGQ